MTEADICRLCTNSANITYFKKIFERNQRQLLRQIEKLIGKRLNKAKELPQRICKLCEEQTLQAHSFRERCIQAQQHLAMKNIKECGRNKKSKLKEVELSDIEELAPNEINLVKEEQTNEKSEGEEVNDEEEEEDDNSKTPLPLITEIILKDEPLDLGDELSAGDSDDSVNPLNEYQRNSTDEEEGEEAEKINVLTNEEVLQSEDDDLKPLKPKSGISKTERNRTRDLTNTICELCGRHFKFKSTLWTHMLRHTGEKRFKCDTCPASFILKTDLERHKRTHTGELPFACSYCDRRFSLKNKLTIHERSHTKERPYLCPTCGKDFFTVNSLKAHMVVHTGVRAHGCKICSVTFKLRKHLLSHYRSKVHQQNEKEHPLND